MFLADVDLQEAISEGRLIVDPHGAIGPNAIDLHLDSVEQARVWDTDRLKKDFGAYGLPELQLNVARMDYGKIASTYLVPPPRETNAPNDAKVVMRDDCVVVRPGGFVLWQTKEVVGTPEEDPSLVCFIDGKSTRARTGLVVHLTAPTIHAGWSGNVTLEMANFGPLHLVLHAGDAIAQIVVAQITRPPGLTSAADESVTYKQTDVTGAKGNDPAA